MATDPAVRLSEAQRRTLRRLRTEHFRLMQQAEEESLHHAREVQRIDRKLNRRAALTQGRESKS